VAIVKDKKDTSVLIETQVPEYVTESHPKFKKFIEKYYEFMESHQIYFGSTFTFHEDKLQAEDQTGENYLAYEDDDRLQLESDRDTAGNANLQFTIGETLTGNTSEATAVVTGTKGNTIAFIKPTNSASFKYGEKVTGDSSRAYATLSNGVVDGTFPKGSIESFRSRGASGAVRDLAPSQDIDLVNEGLIDQAWKKEFYVNIPKTAPADRRQLLKQMKNVYRAKGNEASVLWLFRTLFAKEDIEFYYPKTDLLKISDGKWVLDKTIKIATSGATNVTLFTGRKITGSISKCTALVEKQVNYFAGALEVTELTLSNIVPYIDSEGIEYYFTQDEVITSEADTAGKYATGTSTGIVQNVTVDVGGTNYIPGNEIHISGGGGFGAQARVKSTVDGVVGGINVIDSGDGYAVGDPINFINEETGGTGASGTVKSIIKTGEVLKNTNLLQSDVVNTFRLVTLDQADFGASLSGHNANTHLYGNSSLTFSASIKSNSGKYYGSTVNYDASKHILAGDRIAKQVTISTSGTQVFGKVTLANPLTDEQRREVIGSKLTYLSGTAEGNTTLITGYTNTTVLTVKDEHNFGISANFTIDYASNSYWGTVISATASEILYSVGSHFHDKDLGTISIQNFVNDDNIIVYDSKSTKLGANAVASGVDGHNMHNGVTFQIGNTPISNTSSALHTGAFNMTSVDIGAIDSFTLASGGKDYKTVPPVSVANSYVESLGSALDVVGVPNSLLNLNLHSTDSGTISQDGDVITLIDGTFPDANSGVLTLTYANGDTTQVTSVTNSSTLTVSTQKLFGIGLGTSPDRETYSLSYMAQANNFTPNSFLYNDDYTTRGKLLDFIDKSSDNLKLSRIGAPPIANGNTTLRVDMTTAKDFSDGAGTVILENVSYPAYDQERLLLEGDTVGRILIEETVMFFQTEDAATHGENIILNEDGVSRFYTEDTTGERVTAHSNTVSTYTTGTITQAGTTVTGIGTVFPNDFVRGTITYDDDSTSTITGYTNATSFTVADTKTIGSGQTYSISYNPVATWGTSRNITVLAYNKPSETGNRTVKVTDNGHYFRSGDKVKISGSATGIFNGVYSIAVANNTTYTYTLPENNSVTSPTGTHIAIPVASAWLATSNASSMDTSIKGKNAVIEVSAIAIGAIKEVSVYNFGAGYDTVPVLSTTSGNQDAAFTASLGAMATYAGYSSGTTGILSGIPKIQDGRYYQTFSYVLKSDFDVNDYRDSIKRLTHPSGLIMFGEVAMRNKMTASLFDSETNNVHDLKNLPSPYQTNEGRIYHNVTILANASTMNVQFSTFGSNNEIEVYTARHPWQAMNGALDTFDGSAVNIQLEAYEDIDNIWRIDYNSFRIEQTHHGLQVGDVVEFSGSHPGWGNNQITSQNWNGEHTVTAVLTSNTYAIARTPDIGSEVDQLLYDGNLYIQLEDQTTGNNIITEDYTLSTFLVWDNTVEGDEMDVGDNILLDDGTLGNHTVSTEGNLLADATYEPVTTFVELEAHTPTGFHTAQDYDTELWLNPVTSQYETLTIDETAPEFLLEDDLLNGSIILENGEVEFQLEDQSTGNDLLLEDGSGYIIAEHYGNLILEEFREIYGAEQGDRLVLDNTQTFSDDLYTFMSLEDYLSQLGAPIKRNDGLILLEEGGDPGSELELYLRAEGPVYRGEVDAGDNIVMEDGAAITERVASVIVTSSNLLMEPTDFLKAKTISYANTFRASATNWDDPYSGALLGQEGDLEFELLLEKGGTYLYPKLQFPEAESGTVSIVNPLLSTDTTIDTHATINLIDSMGYHLLTEDGDKIASEEYQDYSTVGLEGIGGSLLMEDGNLIEYENILLWQDPHEQYADITPAENVLLEHNTWTIIHSAPVYQFIDYLNTLGRILTEDDDLLVLESNYRHDIQEGHFSLERKDYFTDELNEVQVEFNLHDGMSWHFITEDGDHFIEEGDERNRLSRFVTDESKVKPSTREIEYNYPNGNPSLEKLKFQSREKLFVGEVFNDWKDTDIATVPYGLQICRPHYYSQWASAELGFVDGQFEMEDNTGIILLEHPVTNQDKLIQEDFPGLYEDIFTTDKARFDFILLEGIDNIDGKYLTAERGEDVDRILLESSELGPDNLVDYAQEIELEDDSGYILVETGAPDSYDFYESGYLLSEVDVTVSTTGHTAQQAWKVLPAYQYTRIPTRLKGLITIADGGTAVTGSEYCKFTEQLKVGEEFQTEDVTIIAEDSGGDVVLETNERLEHEEITMGDIEDFVLDTTREIRLMDFRWLISQESSTVAAHSSHANVLGVYLERQMSLDDQDDSYLAVGQNSQGTNIGSGGNEESAWDTNNESYWFVTNESDDRGEIDLEDSSGVLLRESLEYENNNIIWEDFSKQLIVEPQAFIVGSITNDQSMTVTRKHLGGVTEAEYRL